eukprot:scpid112952/ scgid30661/ 
MVMATRARAGATAEALLLSSSSSPSSSLMLLLMMHSTNVYNEEDDLGTTSYALMSTNASSYLTASKTVLMLTVLGFPYKSIIPCFFLSIALLCRVVQFLAHDT